MGTAHRKTAARKTAATTALTLPSSIRIADVGDLHTQFIACLKRGEPIQLDLAQVQSTDTSTLQLLVALVSESRRQGVKLTWQQLSYTFIEDAKQLGLSEALGLPQSPTDISD